MKKIILDTDMGNEIDDMFALVYTLVSSELSLSAVTIEPFSGSPLYPKASLAEANEISSDITYRILELAGRNDLKSKVFKGAHMYYKDAPLKTNPAVEAMANILQKEPDTIIAAIGTPVNVALLFNLYPELAFLTKVVWLGGNGLGYTTNREFNFSQDVDAVRKLFESCRNLTVVPCKNVAACLACSVCELKQYLAGSQLGAFLIDKYEAFMKLVLAGKSDVGYSKILWDVSVIAYLINTNWFETVSKTGVMINTDETYGFGEGNNRIDFVVNLSRNPIINDFFTKTIKFL